jgi:digeranylgeranylglycerophospholipid reductase
MNTYDVAVVGAGPIGCFVAQQLAEKGIHVAVFEEHSTIGQPLHCAGLVTQRVFDLTCCEPEDIIQNTIYGAYIHSPSGTTLTIGGNKTHALVINRQRFDETLAHNAQHKGVELNKEHKIVTAEQQENHATLTIQHDKTINTIRCNILIGADGPHSLIRKTFNFPHPTEMLHGIGAELTDTTLDPKFVHIFLGHQISPGFFAWVIPTNTHGTTARIGLCIKKQAPHSLQHYFTSLLQQPLIKGTTVTQKFGGVIPLGPLKKTISNNLMLVGDAAAQVKPTSGGGLYPGLLCATHCAITAKEALHHQQYDEHTLQPYHTRWTKEIGRELALGMRFRRLFTNLTDAQLTKYIDKLQNLKTLDVINTYGDIDYPSRLALPLLKASPSLLSLVPSMLKRTKL